MEKDKEEWISFLNRIIVDAELYCVMARDSELQKFAVASFSELLKYCGALKGEAVERQDEDFTNLLLGFECVANCRSHELMMWIALKEEKPEAAWEHLVSAQVAAYAAPRAHQGFSHVSHHAARLEEIEKLVFPPQVFVSAGYIVRRQECSICGEEYGECNHLIGRPYWGKFCYAIARDLEPNHIAMVENPAGKRCRVTHFSTEEGRRNRMTWKLEAKPAGEPDQEDYLMASAIIQVASADK